MKKFITILWIIILCGAAFIAFHLSNPKSASIPEASFDEQGKIIIDQQTIDDPDEPKTYREYLKTGDNKLASLYYEEAIKSYQKALQVNPDSIEALNKLGEAYLQNNQSEEALAQFSKASTLDESSTFLKVQIARAQINAREIEKARDTLNSLDESNLDVKYYKAIISILFKDFDNAKKQFEELASLQTDQTPIPQADKSLVFLDAYNKYAVYKEGERIFLQLLLAKALTESQEYQASIPLLFDIITQKNNYRDAWIVLGFSYLNIGRSQDAIDALSQAEALSPEKPQTLFYLGLAYFAHNDLDKAILYLEKADKFGYEPKDQIALKLADLYVLKGKHEQAAKKYEQVLSLNKNNLDVYVRAVWLNIDKINNPEKALKLAMEAIEQYPESAMSYNLTGWAYAANGNYEQSEESLQIALSMNPEFDAANLNFGWLYEKQGMNLLAKEYYKKAYILGQGNSIGNLAAMRFNKLTEQELNNFYQVDISAP